jgi:hypothetical protein
VRRYWRNVLVDQKFPNRDDDENGQSDAITDDARLADFFLFDHALRLAVDFALPAQCWLVGRPEI